MSFPSMGAGGRGMSFTEQEVDAMLNTGEELQPNGWDECEKAAEGHNERYRGIPRSGESFHRKFASMSKPQRPTGDPAMPLSVKQAKELS